MKAADAFAIYPDRAALVRTCAPTLAGMLIFAGLAWFIILRDPSESGIPILSILVLEVLIVYVPASVVWSS